MYVKLLFLAAILSSFCGAAFAQSVVSLVITPANSSVSVGGTEQMKVTITMSDNSTVDGTNMVMWSVTPDPVAIVFPTGLLTAHGVGTATIMAVYNNVVATTKVTVNPSP